MREAGLDSRPQTTRPAPLASTPGRPRIADSQDASDSPALMLPPRLGVLRRPVRASLATIDRLVVPVPSSDLDEAAFGQLVWKLSTGADVGVLLLAKVREPQEELMIRRRLTTLAALMQRRLRLVETTIVYESTWIRAVPQVRRPGDVVVCPAEELPAGRMGRRTLADRVVVELEMPAYLLDGFRLDLDPHPPFRLAQVLAWAAPLSLLALFGGVQIQIVVQTQGWLQTLLLVTTVGLELATLVAAESLVSTWK